MYKWRTLGCISAIFIAVKYAVEKNLLTDIALAIHSGISVDEILKDLVAEGR
jgi:hypothetical protein